MKTFTTVTLWKLLSIASVVGALISTPGFANAASTQTFVTTKKGNCKVEQGGKCKQWNPDSKVTTNYVCIGTHVVSSGTCVGMTAPSTLTDAYQGQGKPQLTSNATDCTCLPNAANQTSTCM